MAKWKPGDIKIERGMVLRFIEEELEGEKWSVVCAAPTITDEDIERAAKAIFWTLQSIMHDHERHWAECRVKVAYRDAARAALSSLQDKGE